MKSKIRRLLILWSMPILLALSGCISLGPKDQVKEIEFTRVQLGTPAYVVNQAGKPQVVRAQIRGEDGKLVLGKIDANGMVLIDEPTLNYYRALDAKTK